MYLVLFIVYAPVQNVQLYLCHAILILLFINLACIDECISERECRKFEEGLDNKVKLAMYKEEGRIQEVFAWRK